MNRNIFTLIYFICISFIIGYSPAIADPLSESLTISPETIEVGTFFSGDKLTISGEIPAEDDIIIEVSGHDSKNEFDLQGRVGPFWMTTGQIHIDHVPELYILLLPRGKDWESRIKPLGLGMDQLKSRMTTTSSNKIPADIFTMFIKLKEMHSLYDEIFQATTYSASSNGKKQFTAVCNLPSSIKAGDYTIKATTITQNKVDASVIRKFTVGEVGFIKLVDHLASDRRILYGVSAVVIALLAGLIMGVVFKQSGGSH